MSQPQLELDRQLREQDARDRKKLQERRARLLAMKVDCEREIAAIDLELGENVK